MYLTFGSKPSLFLAKSFQSSKFALDNQVDYFFILLLIAGEFSFSWQPVNLANRNYRLYSAEVIV